jgi:hypothetical protein
LRAPDSADSSPPALPPALLTLLARIGPPSPSPSTDKVLPRGLLRELESRRWFFVMNIPPLRRGETDRHRGREACR